LPFRTKPHLRRRLLVCGLLLLALLLAGEAILRFGIGLGDPPLYVTHPQIEYLLAPDQRVRRFGHDYAVNGLGMRSPTIPAQGEKVLVLGDSIVNGGVQLDQSELATELASAADQHHRLWLQAAAGSWGPPNELAWLRRYGDLVRPTRLVLVLSTHDLADVPDFLPLDPRTHPTVKPLCATTDLLFTYATRARARQPATESPPTPEVSCLTAVADMAAWCRARAIEPVILLHAERSEDPASPGLAAWSAHAAALGVRCVRLLPDRSGNDACYRDRIHLGAEGHRRFAQTLLALWP
jgi:hypothetical protein